MPIPITTVTTIAEGVYKARNGKSDADLIEQLARHCKDELVASKPKQGELTAVRDGSEFTLRFLPQQQRFEVSVPCPLAGRFRVSRKGALDRRMEDFVPARRFHSYDARFDRDFNVQTRDGELTTAILTEKANRDAARGLLERGATAVHLDGDRVKAVGQRKALGPQPSVDDILALVERVAVIADSVRRFAKRHELRPAPKHDPVVVGAWTLLGLLGVSGFVMLVAASVEFTLVRPATFLPYLPLVLLPAPGVVFALALAVQRRTAPYGLVRGLAALTLVSLPLFVGGGLLLANGLLDDTPRQQHDVEVVGKNTREKNGDTKYYAGLESWWTSGEVRWVQVSKWTFEALEPHGSRMRVRTGAGALGLEWIADYDRAD